MPNKAAASKRKETPSAQHKRFVETAKKLGASEASEDFDRAFKRVLSQAAAASSDRPSKRRP